MAVNNKQKHVGLQLSADQAIGIYQCKLQLLQPRSFEQCLQNIDARIRGQSVPVAERFGISPRTVRDIWSRHTWTYATEYLWAQEKGMLSAREVSRPESASKVGDNPDF